jgi:hypothetical protein
MPEGWEMGGIAFQNAHLLAPQSFCAYSALPESPDELAGAMSAMNAILPKRSARRRLSPQPRPSKTGEPLDLSAYRRRAADLLRDLEAQAGTGPDERRASLGHLYRKLRELVHDLRSIAAPAAEVGPLEEVLKELEALLAILSPGEEELSRIGTQAAEKLRLFAGGPAAAVPGGKKGRRSSSREGFWK